MAGRPTKYCVAYVKLAARAARAGFTQTQIARFLDVDDSTLERWIVAYPAFRGAIKDSGLIADEGVVRTLYERARGFTKRSTRQVMTKEGEVRTLVDEQYFPPDTSACIFWLKNRQKELWRDRYEHVMDQDFKPVAHDPTQRPEGYSRKPVAGNGAGPTRTH
jgi:hypothetical protein